MDWQESCAEPAGSRVAAEQDEERYETKDKLEHEQADRGQAAPGVQRVEVHDGLVARAHVFLGGVAEDQAQTYGRGGEHEEDCVKDLGVDLAAALKRPVDEHRLAVQEHKADEHECRVGVELLFPVVLPAKPVVVLGAPVEPQEDDCEEKQLGQGEKHAQEEAAARVARAGARVAVLAAGEPMLAVAVRQVM